MSSEDIVNFRPPEATVGTQVVWYMHGRKRKVDSLIGYIIHSGSRTATIYLCNGRRVDAVRHVSDPKLSLSPEQREQGAWDFTDEHYEMKKFRSEVTRKLAELDKQVSRLILTKEMPAEKKTKKRGGNPNAAECLKEFRKLQKQAKDLGIATSGMKKHDLQQAIAALDGQEPVVAETN